MSNSKLQGQGDGYEFIPGYCFSHKNPVEYALSISLILEEIFRHCVNGKDKKMLLTVRGVCRFWWKEASCVLKNYYDLFPVISTLPGSGSRSTTLAQFVETIKPHGVLPTGGFPLNLIITQWTPQTTQFLTNRAESINKIELKIENLEGFTLEERSFDLARLRYAAFSFDIASGTYHNHGFQDLLVRFKDLIKDTNNLKDCEVRLSLPDAPKAINDDSSFIQLPRQLTLLKSWYRCFEQLASSQTWPKLKELMLKIPLGNDASPKPIHHLTNKVSHVTCLKLEDWSQEWERHEERRTDHFIWDPEEVERFPEVELPLMPDLTRLVLWNVGIRGKTPLPRLLPKLREVAVYSRGSLHVLSYLIRGELPNVNVTQFSLDETDIWQNDGPDEEEEEEPQVRYNLEESVQRMTAFTNRFPNLVKLQWLACEEAIFSTTSIIFSNLERLKILSIKNTSWYINAGLDTVKLITGLPREEIPEDEASWPESLVGRSNAITNLKCLEGFSLILYSTNGRRESRFLIQAAFNQTENLKFINIPSPILDEEAQAEWVARGNVFISDARFAFPDFEGNSIY